MSSDLSHLKNIGEWLSQFAVFSLVGAWTKLNWTIAVIMPLHGQTADALAVVAALPIVSSDFAKVFVHYDLIFLRK